MEIVELAKGQDVLVYRSPGYKGTPVQATVVRIGRLLVDIVHANDAGTPRTYRRKGQYENTGQNQVATGYHFATYEQAKVANRVQTILGILAEHNLRPSNYDMEIASLAKLEAIAAILESD